MKKGGSSDAPLVWSSELGRVCPGCGKAVAACVCARKKAQPAGDGIVRVRRETTLVNRSLTADRTSRYGWLRLVTLPLRLPHRATGS